MLNRDSMMLWVGAIGALVLYLQSAAGPPTQWDYNQWLQFVAFVAAFISGKLGTSPLKGENDDKRVGGGGPSGRGDHNLWFLPLLLTGSLLATNCGGFMPSPSTPTVPVITETEQAQVRAAATKALAGIEVAGVVVRDARDMVSQLTAQGVLSVEVRTQVNDAVIRANTVMQRVITEIAEATRLVTVEGLVRQGVDAILELATALEKQSDTRVVMAATFVRGAIRAVAAMVGIEVGQ